MSRHLQSFFFFLITTFINFIPQRQNSQCLHTHSFLSSSPSLTLFTPGHLLHVSFFFSIYLMCFPLCEITTTTIVALKKKKNWTCRGRPNKETTPKEAHFPFQLLNTPRCTHKPPFTFVSSNYGKES